MKKASMMEVLIVASIYALSAILLGYHISRALNPEPVVIPLLDTKGSKR